MGKQEMIDQVAYRCELSKVAARQAVDAVFDLATESLEAEGRFAFPGFGTFKVVERAARTGRNPATKAAMEIPARRVVKFRAAPALLPAPQE